MEIGARSTGGRSGVVSNTTLVILGLVCLVSFIANRMKGEMRKMRVATCIAHQKAIDDAVMVWETAGVAIPTDLEVEIRLDLRGRVAETIVQQPSAGGGKSRRRRSRHSFKPFAHGDEAPVRSNLKDEGAYVCPEKLGPFARPDDFARAHPGATHYAWVSSPTPRAQVPSGMGGHHRGAYCLTYWQLGPDGTSRTSHGHAAASGP